MHTSPWQPMPKPLQAYYSLGAMQSIGTTFLTMTQSKFATGENCRAKKIAPMLLVAKRLWACLHLTPLQRKRTRLTYN